MGRGGPGIVSERGAQIGIIRKILSLVERVERPAFALAEVDIMCLACCRIGAEGSDQVRVRGDILPSVDLGRRGRVVGPSLGAAKLDEMLRRFADDLDPKDK